MVEMTAYAHGTPNWVDVTTPDLDTTKAFYGGLFGWEAGESSPDLGYYTNFLLRGEPVCGLVPTSSPDQPPAWTTYFATDDADATTRAVQANGGQIAFPPMDVMELGRMAVFSDPTGAHFGAWQPGTFAGAAFVGEPGALVWNHLVTRDMGAAKSFYPAVFGWETQPSQTGGDGDAAWTVGGQPVAGGHQVGAEVPPENPPHWLVHFAVADKDATVTKARELGGTVLMEDVDTPFGSLAVITDPHGAVFAAIQMR